MKKKYITIAISLLIVIAVIACGQVFTVRHVSVVFYNKSELVSESAILEASGINGAKNIFNVKESAIKAKVASAYPDNSVVVTNIERKFPNKIIIYVKERVAIFKISVSSEGENAKFVPTDKDFQMGKTYSGEYGATLVEVKGLEVYETFDRRECVQLRTIANALIEAPDGPAEEAIPFFIESITFSDDRETITILIRETGAQFVIEPDDLESQVQELYANYLSMSEIERYGAILQA